MRSILVAVFTVVAIATLPELVRSDTCPTICSTKELWGYGSAAIGYRSCECTDPPTGDARRTGPDCVCDVCYKKEGTKVVGYSPANGACRTGETDCTDCGLAATDSGSGSSTNTTSPAPTSTNDPASDPSSTSLTPSSPSGASSSANGNTGAPGSSSSKDGSAQAGSDSSSDSSMATWQIALIICSCVLVFAVVVMTIMSCYCKTRKQMKDHDTLQEETREYEHYWHPASSVAEARPVGKDNRFNNSAISAQLTQGGRSSFTSSHSRPNSAKNMPYSEPTFAENDKLGGRPGGRQSLGSRNDLPPVFNAFPPRPTHELDNRKGIAIEL